MRGGIRLGRQFAEIFDEYDDKWWFIVLVTLITILLILFFISIIRMLLR